MPTSQRLRKKSFQKKATEMVYRGTGHPAGQSVECNETENRSDRVSIVKRSIVKVARAELLALLGRRDVPSVRQAH
jgi:hypothetical protein